MKRFLEILGARAFNAIASILRNGKEHDFSREEIRFLRLTFSQFGEDLAIGSLISHFDIEPGTYLDIGAYDPIHCSNTLLLSKKGWRGVNIDINPKKIDRFNELRKKDDNVCCVVSSSTQEFVVVNEGTLTERIIERNAIGDKAPTEKLVTRVSKTLGEALKGTILQNTPIDFVTIDCEGHDFEVLQQLDFGDRRPKMLAIEALTMEEQMRIFSFLEQRNYRCVSKLHWTLVFLDTERFAFSTYVTMP